MVHQQTGIFGSLSQGRQYDAHHIQTEIEVFSKSRRLNLCFEFFVCGGNQPDVHRNRLHTADPLKNLLLENTKQFDLEAL